MCFHAQHRFAAPVDAVLRLLVDPAFHRQLQLPDLTLQEVVDSHSEADRSVLRLRYESVGHLDPIARRLLGSHRLTWLQEICLDHAHGTGTLSFTADAGPERMHGAADFTLEASDGGTVRRLDCELVVAVPLIGRKAEQRIVPGLLRRLDVEAAAVDETPAACMRRGAAGCAAPTRNSDPGARVTDRQEVAGFVAVRQGKGLRDGGVVECTDRDGGEIHGDGLEEHALRRMPCLEVDVPPGPAALPGGAAGHGDDRDDHGSLPDRRLVEGGRR